MSEELSEFWRDQKEKYRKRCLKRQDKYVPLLEEIGAECKTGSIYEMDGYFLYPTKGFAMNKRNYRDRMSLDEFIAEHKPSCLSAATSTSVSVDNCSPCTTSTQK